MSTRKARPEPEDDWPETVIVSEEDLVWDEKLGYHRCPLGLIQTPRPTVGCREWTEDGTGLKLYVQQLEREGICDVVVVEEDEHERPLNGRCLDDAETGNQVGVERFEDAVRVDVHGASTDGDAATDPDLDIPF
ncbi:MAG TPA: hypothetical protein VG293_01345 [Solirubrobacteraceae bacterium]|nr:hypothetical protein [Solirubrobacteraceae bacterium]